MDNHYLNDDADRDGLTDYQEARIGTNIYLLNTDGDGITDAIEIKAGADALNKEATPWATGKSVAQFDEKPIVITAEVSENGERVIKGIVLAPNKIAYLDDFDITNDKLYFSKTQFSDLMLFDYMQSQGMLRYNNIHFATFEQGLDLDIQRFELV